MAKFQKQRKNTLNHHWDSQLRHKTPPINPPRIKNFSNHGHSLAKIALKNRKKSTPLPYPPVTGNEKSKSVKI